MIVTEQQAQKALDYLAQTDLESASWHGAVMRAEFMLEAAEALAYLSLSEGSIEDRKRKACLDENVKKAQEELIQAKTQEKTVNARRKRAEITIEVWRSLNANRRSGNI